MFSHDREVDVWRVNVYFLSSSVEVPTPRVTLTRYLGLIGPYCLRGDSPPAPKRPTGPFAPAALGGEVPAPAAVTASSRRTWSRWKLGGRGDGRHRRTNGSTNTQWLLMAAFYVAALAPKCDQ